MTSLTQQQQENKDSWRSTGDYTSEHLDLLDTLTTSTWNAAQEEMLERTLAKIKPLNADSSGLTGAMTRMGYDLAMLHVESALSSLRAGETPYYKRDHEHCWEQKVAACGLTKHTQCCLCEEPITSEPK